MCDDYRADTEWQGATYMPHDTPADTMSVTLIQDQALG